MHHWITLVCLGLFTQEVMLSDVSNNSSRLAIIGPSSSYISPNNNVSTKTNTDLSSSLNVYSSHNVRNVSVSYTPTTLDENSASLMMNKTSTSTQVSTYFTKPSESTLLLVTMANVLTSSETKTHVAMTSSVVSAAGQNKSITKGLGTISLSTIKVTRQIVVSTSYKQPIILHTMISKQNVSFGVNATKTIQLSGVLTLTSTVIKAFSNSTIHEVPEMRKTVTGSKASQISSSSINPSASVKASIKSSSSLIEQTTTKISTSKLKAAPTQTFVLQRSSSVVQIHKSSSSKIITKSTIPISSSKSSQQPEIKSSTKEQVSSISIVPSSSYTEQIGTKVLPGMGTRSQRKIPLTLAGRIGIGVAIGAGIIIIGLLIYFAKSRHKINRYRRHDNTYQIPGFTDVGGMVQLSTIGDSEYEILDATGYVGGVNPLYDNVQNHENRGYTRNENGGNNDSRIGNPNFANFANYHE